MHSYRATLKFKNCMAFPGYPLSSNSTDFLQDDPEVPETDNMLNKIQDPEQINISSCVYKMCLKNLCTISLHAENFGTWEAEAEGDESEASLGSTARPYLKKTKKSSNPLLKTKFLKNPMCCVSLTHLLSSAYTVQHVTITVYILNDIKHSANLSVLLP